MQLSTRQNASADVTDVNGRTVTFQCYLALNRIHMSVYANWLEEHAMVSNTRLHLHNSRSVLSLPSRLAATHAAVRGMHQCLIPMQLAHRPSFICDTVAHLPALALIGWWLLW